MGPIIESVKLMNSMTFNWWFGGNGLEWVIASSGLPTVRHLHRCACDNLPI